MRIRRSIAIRESSSFGNSRSRETTFAKSALIAMLAIAALQSSQSKAQSLTITTVAGRSGGAVDAIGAAARFNGPRDAATDSAGNVYVADTGNDTIRKVSPTGAVTTLAGLAGVAGSTDGRGAAARFSFPSGVAADAAGNVYVADMFNQAVRRITPAGEVTTIAGAAGNSGSSDGVGTAARFQFPKDVAVDVAGNIYVADAGNNTIRKIDTAGVVTTVAGVAGSSGSVDGTGTAARFNDPEGIAVDSAGNIYVSDTGNHTIRMITPAGAVSTVAGTVGVAGNTDGAAATARFGYPTGLVVNGAGDIFVADPYFAVNAIRKIAGGVVSTFAGSATPGSVDGVGTAAQFSGPYGVAMDGQGNIYVAEQDNCTIRKITSSATVTTIAGWPAIRAYTADGTGSAARFYGPKSVAADSTGTVYATDGDMIRKITSGGVVTTFAGSGTGSSDGTGTAARFYDPQGIATDAAGNVYGADTFNHTIRRITPSGVVTTIAGSAGSRGFVDGAASAARFNEPAGIGVDGSGSIYVADRQNNAVRKIAGGVVSTIAGGTFGFADGTGAAAQFNYPNGLVADQNGNLYVCDTFNSAIRKITSAGVVTTIAGNGWGGSADGVGAAASFNSPYGIAIDATGNLYVADTANDAIRMVTPAAVVTTVAGLPGLAGSADGTSTAARFDRPMGVATDSYGNVWVADDYNQEIRVGRAALPDVATASPGNAIVGTTRQLDSSPQTATSWQWSLIRRPVDSVANISAPTVGNPTFTPDVPGLFTIQLIASGATATSITTVDVMSLLATTTTVSALAVSYTYGNPVTLRATVATGATGTVTFYDNAALLGTATLVGGTASYSTSALVVPRNVITAEYSGDTNYAASTSAPLEVAISQASSVTTVASSANPSSFGRSVTFTATVTTGATGSVTFKDGTATLGTATISSSHATFSTSALTSGSHSITAIYAGDANYIGSTAAALTQVVNAPPTITAAGAVARTAGSAATSATIATVSDPSDAAGTLTVTATSVPTGITITSIANSGGTVTAMVAASCTATTGANTVVLQVRNSSLLTSTASLVVNVSANPTPSLGTYSNAAINAGETGSIKPSAPPADNGSLTLTATASTGYSGTLSADTTTGTVTVTNPNVGTYTITVKATDACGAAVTRSFTLTVNAAFAPPQRFSATPSGTTAVTLTWLPVSGATRYEVWRNTNLSTPYAITTSTGYLDTNVSANTAYLYKVRVVAGSFVSAFTPVDAATTVAFTDEPLTSGTPIRAIHLTELRAAVNAMRIVAGLGASAFTDTTLSSGVTIKAVHLSELRIALDAARALIGLPPITYTDATIAAGTTIIKTAHIQELRNGVK